MKIRRVVTGHDGHGKSVFVCDTEVDPITVQAMPGAEFHRLWGGDRAPRFPDDGARPHEAVYFPPVGGYRFGMFTLPPATQAAAPLRADSAAASRELNEKLPGLADYMEVDAPGMHTTATIDFEVVLEGEVWLELDDGREVHLRAGDTVVQNGTRHAWHNRGSAPARLAVFIVGAEHEKVTPK
jgi:mannose-6-phosphate isomerase-like protein (cupin superfamily)